MQDLESAVLFRLGRTPLGNATLPKIDDALGGAIKDDVLGGSGAKTFPRRVEKTRAAYLAETAEGDPAARRLWWEAFVSTLQASTPVGAPAKAPIQKRRRTTLL